MRRLLRQRFGAGRSASGRWFYDFGERYGDCLLLWREGDEPDAWSVCVDIPGGVFGTLDSHEQEALCRSLLLGGRCSRIDLAVDLRCKDGVGLIDAMIEGCERGHLCGARLWEPKRVYECADLVGYGICIGRRGRDGSGRYVRCYDKGLEQKECPQGEWERFEVEFSGDCAEQVAMDVFRTREQWEWRAWHRVAGAISFREHADGGSYDRRGMCKWWDEFISDAVPEPTIATRRQATFDSWGRWIRDTVAPTLVAMAREAGVRYTDVMWALTGAEPRERSRSDQMDELLRGWRDYRQLFERIPCT